MDDIDPEIDTPWWQHFVPDVNSPEFQKLVSLTNRSSFEPKGYAWKDAPNPKPWCAFGDWGTTALVGAYGDLIQFGAYTGLGQSGLSTVDRKRSEEPYWVIGRTTQLMEWAEGVGDFDKHYGLHVYQALPDSPSDSPSPPESRPGSPSSNSSASSSKREKRILPPSEPPELQWVNYRWPRFKTHGELETTTQWLVHEGLVLQQTQLSYSGPESVNLRIRVPFGEGAMDIRDLDHVDGSYPINVKYKQTFGPNQYSSIFIHDSLKCTDIPSSLPESIAVIASIMQDGRLVRWRDPPEASPLGSQTPTSEHEAPDLDLHIELGTKTKVSTEVVVAYKIILFPTRVKRPWDSFTIPADAMDVSGILSEEPQSPDSLRLSGLQSNNSNDIPHRSLPDTPQTASPHIEFAVRRQLEHILSNCAIPLDPPEIGVSRRDKTPLDKDDMYSPVDWFESTAPVALTCGDMSFHRVSGSASFFAFAFLVEVQHRLDNSGYQEDPYVRRLSDRIKRVCRGHIYWLCRWAEKKVEKRVEEGVEKMVGKGFRANYWVHGHPIEGGDSATWVAEDSLLDTAFQLIKIDDYALLDPEFGNIARNSMSYWIAQWMIEVKEKEHRKSFAWPHAFDNLHSFRLDDHVWIWRALKSTAHPDILSFLKDMDEYKTLAKVFSYRDVQREILRHFTTRNEDISGKRMLAVSRSCRETRFLLHARDTVLFHSIDWGFPLEDPAFHDFWTETIEAQSRHDENHEDQWDNALRYALAVAMGCRNQSLNKRTPQELLKTSLRTLLDSSSPNGLFAGQLDATTKNPMCFLREEDRDFHFHCTFEIPYILLVNASRITELRNEDAQKRPKTEVIISTTPTHGYAGANDFFGIRSENFNIEGNSNLFPPGYQIATGVPGQMPRPLRRPAVFKKRQPFYHLIDSTNIVEIEEEWLYNYPAFLNDRSMATGRDANSLMMTYLLEGVDLREALKSTLSSHPETILTIVQEDEGLKKALSVSLADYTPERRRIMAQMILHISRDASVRKSDTGAFEGPSADQRLRDVYELLHPVLLEFERIADLTPEKVDAIHGTPPAMVESPRKTLITQSSTRSERWWHPGRTQSSPASGSTPGKAIEKAAGPDDPGVPAVEELLDYHEMRERLKAIMRQNVDVFGAIGLKVSAFPDRVAAILDEDNGMLARILLSNKSLYKELKPDISRKVEKGSRIRQEIHRYLEILLSPNNNALTAEKPPDGIEPSQGDVRPSSDSASAMPAMPLGIPDRVDFDNHCGAFVSDTSKKLSQGRGQKAQDTEYNEYAGRIIPNMSLWHEVLKKPREPKKAKKRFVWLTDANPTTALVCFLGSPQVERDPMNLFFDRHADYELYFFDDTTPHLNTWETELHISFYQILQRGQTPPTGIPKLFRATFLGKESCELTKASVGFRFFGDFFDRYWTCHFIEYLPSDGSEKFWNFPFDSSNSRSTINGEWRQRKVLELYLFERIVDRVVSSTREIYELVRQELGVGGETFSMVALYLDSDDYFSSSEHWQKCQEALQVIEDQLEHIVTEIAKWESRERSRGQEKPRWTRRDERKYSGAIKKRLGACNSMVRDLRRLKADITVRKQLLISRQDQIRNDLSLNSAENIRFFTYVTVVFLPLGFSASIFSMSEVPDGQLIGEMAIVAAIALILTAVALATYGMSRKLPNMSKNTVKKSQLVRNSRNRNNPDDAENAGDRTTAAQIAKKKTIWFIGFWLTYVFVEKPLGWVGLGLDVMDQPKWNWVSVFSIAVALCLLPYCLFVCIVRVLAYNAMDLTRLFWDKLKSRLPGAPTPSNNVFRGIMGFLLNPDSKRIRPFKFKPKKPDAKKEKKEADTPVSEEWKQGQIEVKQEREFSSEA